MSITVVKEGSGERKQDEYTNELWNKIREKERRIVELEADMKKDKELIKELWEIVHGGGWAKLEAERDRLREIAERLEVLAVKWVDAGHHDWPEIKALSQALKEET